MQRSIRGLDHGAIHGSTRGCARSLGRMALASLNSDNRVVNSQRRVTHVDLALALERSGPDDGVLGDLVPLLHRVRQRRKDCLRIAAGRHPDRGDHRHARRAVRHPFRERTHLVSHRCPTMSRQGTRLHGIDGHTTRLRPRSARPSERAPSSPAKPPLRRDQPLSHGVASIATEVQSSSSDIPEHCARARLC